MSYAIRAWRTRSGEHGITIGTLHPAGYDNHVAEFDLSEQEIGPFIATCQAAMARAGEATESLAEPLPGAYENWDGPQ